MKLLILLSVLVVVKTAKLEGYNVVPPSGPILPPGGCPESQILRVDGNCVQPEVTRKMFVYTAPEQERESYSPPVDLPPPKVEHNIVFIHTPKHAQGPDPIIVPPPRQHHIVYVLNKQSVGGQRVIEVPAPPSTRPEVYFINYDEGDNPTLPSGIDFQAALNSAIEADAQVILGAATPAGSYDSAVVGLDGHTSTAEGLGGLSGADGSLEGHKDVAGSSEGSTGGFGGLGSQSEIDGSGTSHMEFAGGFEGHGGYVEQTQTVDTFDRNTNGYTANNKDTGSQEDGVFLVSNEDTDDSDGTYVVGNILQSDSNRVTGFRGTVGSAGSEVLQAGVTIDFGGSNSGFVSSVGTSNGGERHGYSDNTGAASITGDGSILTGSTSGFGDSAVVGDINGNAGGLDEFNSNTGVNGEINSISDATSGPHGTGDFISDPDQVQGPSGLYSTP